MNWKLEQRKRAILAKAAKRGTLRSVWTPQGPLRADSPTLSRLATTITAVDAEAGTVTMEQITDAAHPMQDPWTRRWKGATP